MISREELNALRERYPPGSRIVSYCTIWWTIPIRFRLELSGL